MSDFDAFEGQTAAVEEDPAADFLAREQDQLAGLEDDNPVADFGQTDALADQQQECGDAQLDMFDPLADPVAPTEFQKTDTEDILDIEDTKPDAPTPEPSFSEYGVETVCEPDAQGYAAISQVDKQRTEPEQIRKWREDQKIRLQEKDEESEQKKQEWREVAKKELEDWYKHRAEQFEKTKVNNMEAEAAFIQERDENIPGHEWERICRLCEFNPKHSGNKKDISRQRSILLQLKQTPLVR